MTEQITSDAGPQRRSWLMVLPVIVFLALAALFWLRLGDGDPSRIPSALIGHQAPQTSLPPLQGLLSNGAQVPGLDPTNFKGKISVVNVWASWCVPCHDEAPLLTELAKDNRLQLIGINYKDAPDNARPALSRPLWQSVCVGRRRRQWPRRDRMGRLRRARNAYRRPRRQDRLQTWSAQSPRRTTSTRSALKAAIDKAINAASISRNSDQPM